LDVQASCCQARAWRGRAATAPEADAYARHLGDAVFPQLTSIPGHRDARLLRREVDGGFEFLVLTAWDSMDAVRGFAGDHPERAVVEPAARAVLSDFDEAVYHYELVLGGESGQPDAARP
jgi:heme-degrading monooxygenase HmoA